MIQERLAQFGTASGPVVMAYNWIHNVTDILQVVLVVVSIFATACSGIYYLRKILKKDA